MSRLTASVAIGNYDRTRPLLDGDVHVDGVDPVFLQLEPEEIFFRAFRQEAFDICELSLSSFSLKIASGDCPYVGVPAFLSRAFRHSAIYVRTDSDLNHPRDLIGKRMGTAEYQVTANVWARGYLEHQYGVHPSQMTWVRGGLETPGRPEKIKVQLPDDICLEEAAEGKTLNRMLLSGEIDAFMGPRAPSSYDANDGQVRWLFSDPRAEAMDYYHRTRIFPIMHMVGIRRTLVEEHPWLPASVFKAFTQSRDIARQRLGNTAAPKVMLPFVEETLREADNLLGSDYWSFGLRANEQALQTFLELHFAQGLSSRQLAPEDLFHPSTHEMTVI